MAAKVVMVAVPTVLGIASIRVKTRNQVPADGLVSREGLSIYAPLPESAPARFFPESPGGIERGLTTAREGVLPLVQAVKGACVSVKRGWVHLYHVGEDAYYYLTDPPPGFLPRLGTITMAGLLGMFLARKGSRFKRLVVPVGLIGAGASVCYPAQAVAVLKVTGKSTYSAAQWSSSALSSLLSTSKPAAAGETPHTQAATGPSPESVLTEEASASSSTPDSSSQSAAVLEKEAGSSESVSVSDEPVVAVTPEEEPLVTHLAASQALPETSSGVSGSLAASIPVQTETYPPCEEAAPVGNEGGSDGTGPAGQASTDTRPAEPTVSVEPETVPDPSAEEFVLLSEDPSSPETSDMPTVPSEPEPESTDLGSVPGEGTPPPPAQQPAAENSKEGSGYKPNPALMDFGQSSPEDEDLYSTRS
ncbi:MICOS complex subunit MIC27 isoform X1 [Nothobranchius furzeri]|uniref:MICOS complex subunit n=1 Tax=Nothobranchius furzeri TaxID=105023 RepID=A0A1A8UZY3_NOTFU|nr:transcript variant X1 [Nothobranchius furzeri]